MIRLIHINIQKRTISNRDGPFTFTVHKIKACILRILRALCSLCNSRISYPIKLDRKHFSPVSNRDGSITALLPGTQSTMVAILDAETRLEILRSVESRGEKCPRQSVRRPPLRLIDVDNDGWQLEVVSPLPFSSSSSASPVLRLARRHNNLPQSPARVSRRTMNHPIHHSLPEFAEFRRFSRHRKQARPIDRLWLFARSTFQFLGLIVFFFAEESSK